jgi:hypothetical protein
MILVHIAYTTNFNYNETRAPPKLIMESHFYVSDNKEYDMLCVQHCLTKLSSLMSIGIYDAFVLCIELNMLCVYKKKHSQENKYLYKTEL